jgi:7-cyano-7-deazaguanine synthase
MKQAVLSLSGGMDSSTLLLHLLSTGYQVTALSFDYGQKHRVELERAQQLITYINEHLFSQNKPLVRYQTIRLEGLSDLLSSALVTGGSDVPEGHYAHENMKETVVPNRNKIFSSLIQAVALSIATKNGKQDVAIAMGIHAGDHAIYPDCRKEFRNADQLAFELGNWDYDLVKHYTPFLYVNKFDILKHGEECCKQLGLDFDEVYKRTNTSYKPILIDGKWYSDYKSASSVERIEAFIKLDRPDPVEYADENGPTTWTAAQSYVREVLESFETAK